MKASHWELSLLRLSYEITLIKLDELLTRRNRFQQYAVKAVPSIAINGELILTGKPSRIQLEALGLVQCDENVQALNYLGMGFKKFHPYFILL